MSIQVYSAFTIEPLANELANQIKIRTHSVFLPDFIACSNVGVMQYLKIKIAEENGIAANLKTCSAKDLLSIVYKILGGKDENKFVLNDLQQRWIIFELLDDEIFKDNFSSIADYYRGKPAYQIALADKISTLFNQYSLYMPDRLESWIVEDFDTDDSDEAWQYYLWRAFKEKINAIDCIDDNQLFGYITSALKIKKQQELLKEKLPVLYLFDVSDFNTYLLNLFIEISEVIDVKIFYSSTIKEIKEHYNNELVHNLKGISTYMLKAFKSKGIELIWLDNYNNEKPNSLLDTIKMSLVEDKNLESPKVNDNDTSITINSCFSPIREVEVLYNYLVKLVDDSKNGIGARDIVVYCSDLNTHAPAISAVFENTPYSFPYHIVGKKENIIDSSVNALQAILQIDKKYMQPSLVMQLLEFPSILVKYEFKDVELLRELIKQANIKNAFKGDKFNETNLVSWTNGLKRLCYGMLMSGEEWFDDGEEEYLLIDKVEGSGADDLVRFNYLIHNLYDFLDGLNVERNLKDWILYLHDGLDLFFDKEKEYQIEYLTTKLAEVDFVFTLGDTISFEIIHPIILSILEGLDKTSQTETNKGIRFCPLSNTIPLPNKIVAMLGLNSQDYPRQTTRLSYDLIKSNPESILQDIREKDKSFFLKTILSTKEHLYISYLGKSSKNNAELAPSSLVDGLLDYLNIEGFVKEHPLHSFNSKYFNNKPGYYSYLGKTKTSSGAHDDSSFNKSNPKEENDNKDNRKIIEIPLYEFINFFKDSFKHYYNKKLKIYYREETEVFEDSELFALGTLEKWYLKTQVTQNPKPTSQDIKTLKAQGNLPLGTYGDICIENLQDELSELTNEIEQLKEGYTQEQVLINNKVEIEGVLYLIKGEIDAVYVNNQEQLHIFSNVSKSKQKYQFEAFINLLFLKQMWPDIKLYFLWLDKRLQSSVISNVVDSESFIKTLLNHFLASNKGLNPFYINDYISEALLQLDSESLAEEPIGPILEKDGFLSEYVKKEQESLFFEDLENKKRFYDNSKFLNETIFNKFN
ncbi:exodeoxyribonuclease V subunit gamma [Polaribacter litorisediminis]|uniref:exodeoxyribonuclease V subunit gamma n=1 Tax=Polaribacter litorisediminis TaxID=1908341 RepID=UPI001CBF08DD|nr:exodeoxyribonuclease V subunit gamma [Polaribacter litorisediminis]UAM97282.1 exodeoxyribonuclease V subunit gamma [Polaribacter litorisediminis]